MSRVDVSVYFFFFNDTATTEIYTLSLHDALPIYLYRRRAQALGDAERLDGRLSHLGRLDPAVGARRPGGDRKSTRLNSSHANISYAVFCLKKKKTIHLFRPLLPPLLPYFSLRRLL